MKKTLIHMTLGLAMLFTACQVIPEKDRLVEVDPSTLTTNRTTLICEFSGYRCVNCPTAAEEAHKLLEQFAPNLVVVEVHPPSNSFTEFVNEDYNYTCEAADIYYKAQEGWNGVGFPTGVINLHGGFQDYTSWGGLYVASAAKQSTVALEATPIYNKDTRVLEASVRMDNLQDEKQNLHLIAWLTEDSIVGAQLLLGNKASFDYVHNHLLRDTLTQAWGEPIQLVTTTKYELRPYTLPEKCRAEHCKLVILALKEDEVIQALQVPIL